MSPEEATQINEDTEARDQANTVEHANAKKVDGRFKKFKQTVDVNGCEVEVTLYEATACGTTKMFSKLKPAQEWVRKFTADHKPPKVISLFKNTVKTLENLKDDDIERMDEETQGEMAEILQMMQDIIAKY